MRLASLLFASLLALGAGACAAPADDDGVASSDDALTGACFSSTLNASEPPLTCVQSRADDVWYQCSAGKWLAGVNGSTGPKGACASVHALAGAGGGSGDADDPQTACTSLAHIGDSLTAYTIPALEAEYEAHGVAHVTLSAYGGRAVQQKLPADPETGLAAAKRIVASGFDGCWVVALGTNDTANIAAGANVTRGADIDKLMNAIDANKKARVMWVNAFTIKTSGYWAEANMKLWDQALDAAKGRWPNLRVFDWAKTAATGRAPFVDGIHHTTAGYAVRNQAIADALAAFFPAVPQ